MLDLVIMRRQGRIIVLQTGVITRPVVLDFAGGDEYPCISFKPGVFMPATAAVAHMPWDAPLPRAWAERKVNVQQFIEMPRGGHFSAWEIPEAYAQDLQQFARILKA